MSYRSVKLCKIHVNPIVQRGMLRAMVRVKRIKDGKMNMTDEMKRKDKKESVTQYIEQTNGIQDNLHKYCLRCGKRLKKLEHMQRGYGAICYEKVKNNHSKRLFDSI